MSKTAEEVLKYDYVQMWESQVENFKKSHFMGQGQLVLTNRKLVFVKFGMSDMLVKAGAKYATSEKLAEGLAKKGSFAIPIGEITDARATTHMMDPALLVKREGDFGTKWYRVTPSRKFDALNRSFAQQLVTAITGVRSKI